MIRKIFSALLASVTFVLAICGIYRVRTTHNFENADWMKQLNDETYLSELSIPGSHNSCALYEPVYQISKCQKYSLEDQLEMGVRFIDLKCKLSGDNVKIVNNGIYQCAKLDDVLKVCYSFLTKHPSETIIMSAFLENNSDFEKTMSFTGKFMKYIYASSQMWYLENHNPKLGQIRGKIVLFNRSEIVTKHGINVGHWLDNTVFTFENDDFSVCVQDCYYVKNSDTKWEISKEFLIKANNSSNNKTIFVNFMNATSSVIPNTVDFSKNINKNFLSYMSEYGDGRYGIVIFDYINNDICEYLIKSNNVV